MLKILDRYIIKKFLSTFFFSVLIFTLISIIIDLSANTEKFIEGKVPWGEIFGDYYLNWVLWINGLLFPLYALIGVVFFTARMAYNSEIISILNAGISFRRLMRPYLIGGLILFGIHLVGNHYVIPLGNQKHYSFQHEYIWKNNDRGKTKDVHLFIGPNTKIYIDHFNKKSQKATDFRVEKIIDNKIVYLLKAQTAEWLGPPDKWRIHNYTERTFDGVKEGFVNGEKLKMDTTFNLTPADFVRYINHKEMLTTPELNSFIQKEKGRGVGNTKVYEVELHRRTAEPFTILILTLIGFAVASRKVRGGMGFQLAIGVGIGAIFIFISKFSATFSINDSLPAIVGVWIPNVIFSIIAIFLILKSRG